MSNSSNGLPQVSKLAKLQAQFQQKQMQEKEQKLIKMFENQQQNAMQKFLPANGNSPVVAPGKVRQMFEERRRGGTGNLTGIDKSYPLEPLVVTPNGKSRSTSSKSDPSPSTQARTTRNKELKVRSDTFSNGPYEVITKKGPSSDAPFTSNNTSTSSNYVPSRTVGARSANVSRQYKSSSNTEDENYTNNNTLAASDRNHPLVPTTTKYTDYTNELNSKRETTLANKLNKMQISTPASTPASRKSTPSTPIRSAAPAPVKSKTPTPVKRSGPPQPGLDECKICGRYFAPDRIQKHETICKKTKTKKRKVFDPTKMRMEGTEAEPYLRIVSAKVKKPPQVKPQQSIRPTPNTTTNSETKKADWRKKHEEFIKTIRAAKEYQQHVARGGNPNDLPPPPPSDNSDYIQCPYCNRKFAEAAAHRHIPKCKNIKSNKR